MVTTVVALPNREEAPLVITSTIVRALLILRAAASGPDSHPGWDGRSRRPPTRKLAQRIVARPRFG